MSLRNIRKIYGTNDLPPPDTSSEEEYEPLYAKTSGNKFKYEGLEVSSHSECEQNIDDPFEDARILENRKNKKKKRRKSNQVQKKQQQANDNLDEIDKCVMEVNAMLGAPKAEITKQKPPADIGKIVLSVEKKHLNPINELKRLFGPEPFEEGNKRRGRKSNTHSSATKAAIMPLEECNATFRTNGLSMSVYRRDGDNMYFTFDHNRKYQNMQREFLLTQMDRHTNETLTIDQILQNMHIERLLKVIDYLFYIEQYNLIHTLIGQAINFMQYVAHPLFNLTNIKVRLEYKYLENRPFHVAVFKYIYLLSNKACHRTALELVKLLLNLDPSDPLAMVLIIDTVALRAREHKWLIDFINYWAVKKDAGFLVNMVYSKAMAHFHVATKKKADLTEANQLLQTAMLQYPYLPLHLLECANVRNERIQSFTLFTTFAKETMHSKMFVLVQLYVSLCMTKWRERDVMNWFIKNAIEVGEKFDSDPGMQERAKRYSKECGYVFKQWPTEVKRHFDLIQPMTDYIAEGGVPNLDSLRAEDILPTCFAIDRYNYYSIMRQPYPGLSSGVLPSIFMNDPDVPLELRPNLVHNFEEVISVVEIQRVLDDMIALAREDQGGNQPENDDQARENRGRL